MKHWIRESIFYHIYPLGFCGAPQNNSASQPVNRVHKISDLLPHLLKLGINALYLGPVFESSEHGYDTADYYQVDRRLGTNEDFKAVCDTLKKNGIRIVLDGVFNHVGRDFWAFQDVMQKGQQSPYCSWFSGLRFNARSPYGDPFCYDAWEGHFNLVKLNLQNEDVVSHLLGAVGLWIKEFQIDGLRLDAADCISPAFFERLKAFCKEQKPDFWLMGEIIHGDYTRWANPHLLDSVTNYECYKGLYSSHNDHNYFEIAYSLDRQFGAHGIYKDLFLYSFADNHDVNRLASTIRNPAHLPLVYTLLYTMPGIPSVYYGSEWGLLGTKQNGSDAALRLDWESCISAPHNETLFSHLEALGHIRQNPVLQYGSYHQVLVKNEQLVFQRKHHDESIYVVLNLADHAQSITFPCESPILYGLLSQKQYPQTDTASYTIEIPAVTFMILSSATPQQAEPLENAQDTTPVSIMTLPVPGRYRHFKGNEYEVIGTAKHSETLEELVVYRALYGERGLWVRPVEMFTQTVMHEGKNIPRFVRIDANF